MMQPVDVIVLIVYVAAVTGFGAWFMRKSRTTSSFMAAGGALPGWAVGLSIFGTYLSSNTFLGVPGKAYGSNFNSFVFSLTLPIAAFVAVRFFVPFYRRGGEISAYHHFERRFGLWARTYAMICYLLTQVARMGSIMFGVALGLHALTGWNIAGIIVVTGFLVTIYTLLGGIEAVIWTDAIQSVILMGGALVILGLLLAGMPEGVSGAFEVARAEGKLSLGSWAPDFTASTVWVMLLYGLFINLSNFGIDQNFVQRYHAASSDKAAGRALWLGALLYVPVSLLFFVIGAALFSYYEGRPAMLAEVTEQVAERTGAEAAALGPADIGDKVLPHFIAGKLSFGAAGLLIAAIFAAAMSSIDTSLNSSATIILRDLYQRYWRPEASERESMTVLRVATVVVGLIGVGTALALIGVKSILDAWWLLQGVFAGGLLGLFLLGIISRRAGSGAAAAAVLLGVLVIAWMTFTPLIDAMPPFLRSPLHANMVIVIGTLTIFLAGLALSRVMNGRSPSRSQERRK